MRLTFVRHARVLLARQLLLQSLRVPMSRCCPEPRRAGYMFSTVLLCGGVKLFKIKQNPLFSLDPAVCAGCGAAPQCPDIAWADRERERNKKSAPGWGISDSNNTNKSEECISEWKTNTGESRLSQEVVPGLTINKSKSNQNTQKKMEIIELVNVKMGECLLLSFHSFITKESISINPAPHSSTGMWSRFFVQLARKRKQQEGKEKEG